MPASNPRREWLFSIPLVAYWAVLFCASMLASSPAGRDQYLLPMLVLGGLPIFMIAARIIIHGPARPERDLAFTDDLTSTANRRAFIQDAHLRLKHPRAGSVGLLLFDVKGLKQLNDACGHQAGDELLVGISRRFAGAGGKLYRIGGDQFAILVQRSEGESVTTVARQLDEACTATLAACGHIHEIRLSYGMASNRSGDNFEQFFRRADDQLLQHTRAQYHAGDFEDRRRLAGADAASGQGERPNLRLLG